MVTAFLRWSWAMNCSPTCIDELLSGADRLGFPSFLYCENRTIPARNRLEMSAPQSVFTRGLSEESIRTWQQSQYNNDPVRHAFLYSRPKRPSSLPVVWENCDGELSVATGPATPSQRAFMRTCYAQGVRTGVNIPIRSGERLSIVSFFSDAPLRNIRRLETKTARLFLLGYRIQAALDEQSGARERETLHLSPREMECMRWVAQGKNATEVAQILGISVLTARDYLKSVSVKLNTVTRAQALAKLLRMGYLE